MKSIYYNFNKNSICFLSLILFTFSSCNDILDTEPITDEQQVSQDEIVIKNAELAEKDMLNVYRIFADQYWQFDYFFKGDAGSDVAYAGADQVPFFQIDEYKVVATNYVVERDWNGINKFIETCNLIINHANNVPDLDQSRKDEMIGEASLYRALSRFQGVLLWGDFPIVSKYISSINESNFDELYPDLYPSRKPVAEVYEAIIADCEVALTKAPSSSTAATSKFKATKDAAHALLAKAYASKPSPDWGKVIQHCDAIINSSYSLLPTFDHLFDNAHEGNAESIWEVNGQGSGSLINAWCTQVFIGDNWKKFNTPSHAINNALDSKRKTTSIKKFPTSFADPYWTTFTQRPFPWKMRKEDGTQNFYIFRLADIILLKAEALARTEDLVGAMALVNQIRTRVTLANVAPAISEDDAINKILKERFMELAFEGHRWFDLKRTGKTIEVLSQQTYPVYNPETQISTETLMPYISNLTSNDLVWPIPQSVLDNNPNMTQNPGY